MNNNEIAFRTVVKVAGEDEYWEPGDECLVAVEDTDDPEKFTFSVAGMVTDRGCVIVRDGKADVYYHDDETGETCQVCGWRRESMHESRKPKYPSPAQERAIENALRKIREGK